MDSTVTPGADFCSESMWIVPGEEFNDGVVKFEAHKHEYNQMIGYYGYNYDDIHDLGAEVEFTVDGEKHVITESFSAFIPAGLQHGPLIIRNVTKPIFVFSSGPTEYYE